MWGETSSLGAALWAIEGADALSALEDIESMVPIAGLCTPNPEDAEGYEKIYEVYKKLHEAINPLFRHVVSRHDAF